MAWKPASMSRNRSMPTEITSDSPMAESNEYRPPTQSQISNMLAVSIPKSATRSALVDTATKCLATAASSPTSCRSQSRAVRALVSVSRVPKVFEQTMNRVSVGSRSMSDSAMSVPSTLETNRNVMSRWVYAFSAS